MRVVLLSAGLAAMMTFITGCSSECESICSEANACELTSRSTDVDCPEFCADVDKFNERAVAAGYESCDAQFQAHMDCWSQNTAQICNTETFEGCVETGDAWTECMAEYCAAVLEETGTPAPNCYDDAPALYPF